MNLNQSIPIQKKNTSKHEETKKIEKNVKKEKEKIIKNVTKENCVKIPQKTETKKISNLENKQKRIIKSQNSQRFEPDLYERLENRVAKPVITHDKNLLEDLENQEMIFLRNNLMPHELEYTNPQIKNYYKPQVIALKEKKNEQTYKKEQISKQYIENG